MHRVFAVLLSILFVCSFVGMPCAAEKENKQNLAAGAVKAIDIKAKTITLRADKKPDFTCSIDDKTVLNSNNGQKITFADIKIGNIIVLFYDEVSGKNIAKSVTVAGQIASPTSKKND